MNAADQASVASDLSTLVFDEFNAGSESPLHFGPGDVGVWSLVECKLVAIHFELKPVFQTIEVDSDAGGEVSLRELASPKLK